MNEAERIHEHHEKIRAEQRQISEPFADANPSEVHEVFWIIARVSSKVSTMRPNANSNAPSKKVICVYTYDATDEEDVMRVRDVLLDLGHTQKLAYKTDRATMERKYQVNGHNRISKYWL